MENRTKNILNALLNSSEELLALFDETGELMEFNDAFREAFHFLPPSVWDTPKIFWKTLEWAPSLISIFQRGVEQAIAEQAVNYSSSIDPQNVRQLYQLKFRTLKNTTGEVLGAQLKGTSLLSAQEKLGQIKKFNKEKQKYVTKLKSVFASPIIGIALINEAGEILEHNQKFEDILEHSDDMLRQLKWKDLIQPDDYFEHLKIMDKLSNASIDHYITELHMAGSTNEKVPVELSSRVVFKAKSTDIDYFIFFIRDLRQQKVIEGRNVELFNQISQFKLAIENSAFLIKTNTSGKILDINEDYLKHTGYNSGEVIGNTPRLFSSGEHDRSFYVSMWKKLLSGNVWHGEFKNKKKDGTYYWLHAVITPIKDSNGELSEFLSISFDITKTKESELEIRSQKSALDLSEKILKNKNRQLEDFANIASHNLRTPVNNIKSLMQFYDSCETPDEKDEIVGHFKSVVQNLNSTIIDLTEVVTMTRDNTNAAQHLAFQDILDITVASLSIPIKEKSASIDSDFSMVQGISYPKVYLESFFLNFLSNALKYSSPKREPIVKVTSSEDERFVHISFKDNGLGIDMKKHGDKLFGLNKTFHKHHDSRGVGLYITKNQIEALGGEIRAESTVDQGTEFILSLLKE